MTQEAHVSCSDFITLSLHHLITSSPKEPHEKLNECLDALFIRAMPGLGRLLAEV
jgi:hypothetical protein